MISEKNPDAKGPLTLIFQDTWTSLRITSSEIFQRQDQGQKIKTLKLAASESKHVCV